MELIAGMLMVQMVVMLMACGIVCSMLVRIERSVKQHAAAAAEAAHKQEEQDDDFTKDFQKIMNYTGARYER